MMAFDDIVLACGVIVDPEAEGGFAHLATAWSAGPGEWVTSWQSDEPFPASARLIIAATGEEAAISNWEQDEDQPVAGFVAAEAHRSLAVAAEGVLKKRLTLQAVGYASIIDHSLFKLERTHLTVDRYVPYLCPWELDGHCCLFTVDNGFINGRFYAGMQGGPVVDQQGKVVGLLLDGSDSPEELPLTRFHRLS